MSAIGNRMLSELMTLTKGLVAVDFSFVINGTSNPLVASNGGDFMRGVQVTRAAAGKFTFTLPTGLGLRYGAVSPLVVADNVDLVGELGGSSDVTTGAVIVRTKTGAVATDPPDGTVVKGILWIHTSGLRTSK